MTFVSPLSFITLSFLTKGILFSKAKLLFFEFTQEFAKSHNLLLLIVGFETFLSKFCSLQTNFQKFQSTSFTLFSNVILPELSPKSKFHINISLYITKLKAAIQTVQNT